MEAFMHPELPLDDQPFQDTGPALEGPPAGKHPRRRKPRPEPVVAADPDIADSDQQPTVDLAAAAWNHRSQFAEGRPGGEARARMTAANAALRPIASAFERHEESIGRSQKSLRKALARSYGWALEMRDQPEVINALLAEKRIRNAKPLRDNVFLAAVKLANPGATPDGLTRWAGALAFAAVHRRKADDVAEFLHTVGIREAADGWTEIRRAGKPGKKRPHAPKPTPLDELRSSVVPVLLPDNCPGPGSEAGPFLLIAERTEDGRLVAYAALKDERMVMTAAKSVLKTAGVGGDRSAAT